MLVSLRGSSLNRTVSCSCWEGHQWGRVTPGTSAGHCESPSFFFSAEHAAMEGPHPSRSGLRYSAWIGNLEHKY